MDKETALKILRERHDSALFSERTALETFIPELKESYDERIRKGLVAHLKELREWEVGKSVPIKTSEHYDAWLALLEKQGENISLPKFTFDDVLALQCAMEAAKKVQKDKDLYEQLKSLHDRLHDAYWLKKQGKQNLANSAKTCKVEPKFKVKYAGSEYNVFETKNIAGVTYYGIEDDPNHIDYVQAENCERVDGYSIKESGSPFPTKPAKFSEQNPTWSEEDEFILKDAITAVDMMLTSEFQESNPNLYKSFKVAKHWLKSLKDRVQPRPKEEWSEEDEAMLDTLIADYEFLSKKYRDEEHDFFTGMSLVKDDLNMISWLKSLKERYAWKPSDKQMEQLGWIADQNKDNLIGKELMSLYQDLKKLREE